MDLRRLVLDSKQLRLSAFQSADAPEIFAAVTPRVTRYMTFDPEPSLAAFASVWPLWLDHMAAGTDVVLVVRHREAGEFLGVAGLHKLDRGEPVAGLWLKETAQGLGYGPEAVAAMIAWAAEERGVSAVLWPVVETNRPSRRLAEGLGGAVIGTGILRKRSLALPEVIYRIPALPAAPG
jgi:RimJ/RimL family protein N-acetyltransferase